MTTPPSAVRREPARPQPDLQRLLNAAKAMWLMRGIDDPRMAVVWNELGEAIKQVEREFEGGGADDGR